MEKYIKNLSIAFIIMTTMFFLNMFGAANLEGTNTPQVITTVLIVGANALLYLIPLMYMGIFSICMASLFKRVLNTQNRMVQKALDKFPTLWFVLSTLSFVGYFVFVSLIFG